MGRGPGVVTGHTVYVQVPLSATLALHSLTTLNGPLGRNYGNGKQVFDN